MHQRFRRDRAPAGPAVFCLVVPLLAGKGGKPLHRVAGGKRPAKGGGEAGSMSVKTQEQLLIAVGRDRDKDAFAALFSYFAPRLKSFLLRQGTAPEGVEELVQEAMLMVWRRAETFDPSQASASTWIFTIARNKRIDALRRTRRPELDPEDPALVPEAPAAADDTVFEAQRDAVVKQALKALPVEQAELLRLAYFEDKSHGTIAAENGIPIGTVKSRIRLALAKLRQSLASELM